MIKFIFAAILAAVTTMSYAKTTVPVVWPFSMAGAHGAMWRAVIEESNRIQDKYHFVVENRLGGGGVIAINYASNYSGPVVMIHSGSYFFSPHVPNNVYYDVDQFNIIQTICLDQPLGLISKKFKTVNEAKIASVINTGIIQGSAVSLVAIELSDHLNNTDIRMIPYKGTPEMLSQVLGGHIDASVGFVSDALAMNLNMVGITGIYDHPNATTFKSQGLSGFEKITASYYFFMPANSDNALQKEITEILSRASNIQRVKEICERDYGRHIVLNDPHVAKRIFNEKKQFWKAQAERLK
jgi:tripartite-type tricarboxylate transporter receptor subunit TctC